MSFRTHWCGWIHYLCVAGMTLPLLACAGSGAATQAASADGTVLMAPLKIPMPLDKAGFKVDVTFDVPPPPKVSHSTGYFLGIRMLFAPSDPDKKIATIDAHPVEVRLTLHRLQDGKEVPVKIWNSVAIIKGYESIRYESIALKDDVAVSRGLYSDHSGAPPGTPDASTYVLEFGGPGDKGPGRFRLRLETLKDIPQLNGYKAFLVYERAPDR
ncbi:MAG: hypothetical protein KDF54_15360 [Hydrogenophaga sp.]|nr:hypothetical protein [Hydrogenophaga sp.]